MSKDGLSDGKQNESLNRMLDPKFLFGLIKAAIFVQDINGKIIFWNNEAENLYGWKKEEILGKKVAEVLFNINSTSSEEISIPLPSQEESYKNIQKDYWVEESIHTTKYGKELIVESRNTLIKDEKNNPSLIMVLNNDITEKKKNEKKFIESERIEGISNVVVSLSHDLNNIFTPVLLSSHLIREYYSSVINTEWLDILETNVKRGIDIVKQVLSFIKGIDGERVSIQPKYIKELLEKSISVLMPKTIKTDFVISEDLGFISGDITQLIQALMNICINSFEAMRGTEGNLFMSFENYPLQNDDVSKTGLPMGIYLLITIKDTGKGIQKDIINKVFEPFFTTKEKSRVTGLGLSNAMAIIKSHGGNIILESEYLRGTQAKVYIPVSETMQIRNDEKKQSLLGNKETILIIDDESSVRETTQRILIENNYNSITASNGIEGITLFQENQDNISLILVDMVMPYMDGSLIINEIQKIDPNVKIIAISGSSGSRKILDEFCPQINQFLEKPYSAEKLLTIIKETLMF